MLFSQNMISPSDDQTQNKVEAAGEHCLRHSSFFQDIKQQQQSAPPYTITMKTSNQKYVVVTNNFHHQFFATTYINCIT